MCSGLRYINNVIYFNYLISSLKPKQKLKKKYVISYAKMLKMMGYAEKKNSVCKLLFQFSVNFFFCHMCALLYHLRTFKQGSANVQHVVVGEQEL